MGKEVMGVPLTRLEVPIWIALKSYQEISNGKLIFDAARACKLVPTPEKRNSARSVTDVILVDRYGRRQPVTQLYVIAFKSGDGTGDTTTYKKGDLDIDEGYPNDERVIPRSKKGTANEIHLTLVSHKTDPHADPELFEGRLDLLGIKGRTITKIGELGQDYKTEMAYPKTTYTVGNVDKQRFGDPHAVYNSLPNSLQVCAFIAIKEAMDNALFLSHEDNPLKWLNPELPRIK